ncbi:MAG: hypothetical protein ABJK59_09200 [Erythrobacter sp.]|uniref:hypothetical protein n=1 Tax=Erythrobacter sp. TaxID=1042 RepID=UPI003298E345
MVGDRREIARLGVRSVAFPSTWSTFTASQLQYTVCAHLDNLRVKLAFGYNLIPPANVEGSQSVENIQDAGSREKANQAFLDLQ